MIAGFSAGAQFTQRYAWATEQGNDGSVRFIVSNPSSYLYFTPERPAEACRELKSVAHENCSVFEVPNSCRSYNRYKHGLERIDADNAYLLNAAKRDFVENYAAKEVLYLLGAGDICNCVTEGFENDRSLCYPLEENQCLDTYPDSKKTNFLATDCRSMAQGSNRIQRGVNYVAYLRFLCGEKFEVNYRVVEGMQHDNRMYFGSEYFQEYGFGRKEVKRSACLRK